MGRMEQRQRGRPRQARRVDISIRLGEKLQCHGPTHKQHVLEGRSGEFRLPTSYTPAGVELILAKLI